MQPVEYLRFVRFKCQDRYHQMPHPRCKEITFSVSSALCSLNAAPRGRLKHRKRSLLNPMTGRLAAGSRTTHSRPCPRGQFRQRPLSRITSLQERDPRRHRLFMQIVLSFRCFISQWCQQSILRIMHLYVKEICPLFGFVTFPKFRLQRSPKRTFRMFRTVE